MFDIEVGDIVEVDINKLRDKFRFVFRASRAQIPEYRFLFAFSKRSPDHYWQCPDYSPIGDKLIPMTVVGISDSPWIEARVARLEAEIPGINKEKLLPVRNHSYIYCLEHAGGCRYTSAVHIQFLRKIHPLKLLAECADSDEQGTSDGQ